MPTTLSGRYRLDELIGGGGMGEVWRARDLVLERDVAVKVIRSHLADSTTVRTRLRLEARIAGSLHHPAIVDVLDYGEHEADGRNTPYVVMSLIDGEPLSRVLEGGGALPAGETMAIVAAVAEALQASHSAGVVHRDLKPGNILLVRGGGVMLVDFGIARSADGVPLTDTGTLLGTVDYLSPEQCAGRTATELSDLYALGVVAYACLTGVLPFHRETDVATALAQIQDDLPALPDHIPVAVRELVTRLLAKAPQDRPTTAAEVATAATALATSLPAVPPPLEPVSSPRPSDVAAPTASLQGSVTAAAHRPRRTVFTGMAAVAVLAVAFAFMSATRGPDRATVPSVTGDSAVSASAEVGRAGLTLRTKDVDVPGHERGEVVGQTPAAGTRVDEDSVVTLRIATGQVRVPGADLLGATYARAVARLDDLGLKASRIDATSTKPAGTVIAVDPDSRASTGATVTLTVARAPVVRAPVVRAPSTSGSTTSSKSTGANSKGKSSKGKGKSGKGKGR